MEHTLQSLVEIADEGSKFMERGKFPPPHLGAVFSRSPGILTLQLVFLGIGVSPLICSNGIKIEGTLFIQMTRVIKFRVTLSWQDFANGTFLITTLSRNHVHFACGKPWLTVLFCKGLSSTHFF